jgi:hypothetical protein
VPLAVFRVAPFWLLSAVTLAAAAWACTEFAYWLFLVQSRARDALLAQAGTVIGRAAAVLVVGLAVSAAESALALAYGCVGFALGAISLIRAAIGHAAIPSLTVIRKLLRYSAWQGFAQSLATLSVWFGAFILLLAQKPADSGQFSLAMTITVGVATLAYGMTEYLTIRAAALPGLESLGEFLRGATLRCGQAVAACATLLLFIGVAAPVVFPERLWVAEVYLALSLSVLLGVLHAPLEAAAHYLMAPQISFISRLVRLGCLATAATPAAFVAGAVAVAWVYTGATAVGLIYLCLAVVHRRRRNEVPVW